MSIAKLTLALLSLTVPISIFACASSPRVTDYSTFISELRKTGTLTQGGIIEQDFMAVNGRAIEINGENIQVFEYQTANAMETEAATISPDGYTINNSMISWVLPPHFFKQGRIIVLYSGSGQSILNTLQNLLGPQFAGR